MSRSLTGEVLEGVVEALAYGGDAIMRAPDGRKVFVPFAFLGEKVTVAVVEEHSGFLRARLLAVRTPSSSRVEPRCRHFGVCGGCHYQHLSYDSQLEAKRSILMDLLEHLGGLRDPFVRPPLPSLEQWNYRNYARFALSPEGRLGYFVRGSKQVLPIEECYLPIPPLDTLWRDLVLEPSLPLNQIGLRVGSEGEVLLILESPTGEIPELEVEAAVSISALTPAGSQALVGDSVIGFEVLGRPFRVSPASFFQANTGMIPSLVGEVLRTARPEPQQVALDLYSGVGLFSAFLASRFRRVIAIESNPQAVSDFQVNLADFDNIELYQAQVGQVLLDLDVRPDFVVADPPRRGLEGNALRGLLRMQSPRLAYLSCDPATLARDARLLSRGGYRLESVLPIDLFPQTYHMESLSLWRWEESSDGGESAEGMRKV
ncbi:MAG: class I SAM-dependent RNA methyltransferase [Anaerolineales bacterium]|jgi:23S rRNA (uracil1939-C5)-methyltransferase